MAIGAFGLAVVAGALGAPPTLQTPTRPAADRRAEPALSPDVLPALSPALSPDVPPSDRLRQEGSYARCNDCHRPDPAFSHPVGVPASLVGGAPLPLDKGRITCLTCHDDRAALPHGGTPTGRDALLRNDSVGGDLCVQCHAGGRDRAAAHAAGLGQAHLRWQNEGVSLRGPGGVTHAGLDAESVSCVGCHDGSVAFDATYAMPGGHAQSRSTEEMGGSHPIGVLYQTPDHWPRGAGLRSRLEIDRRLRLFDDRLGCGTCHSPYSQQQDLLVMSNDRSAMCLSCHRD